MEQSSFETWRAAALSIGLTCMVVGAGLAAAFL
jgi:hypothetical protein